MKDIFKLTSPMLGVFFGLTVMIAAHSSFVSAAGGDDEAPPTASIELISNTSTVVADGTSSAVITISPYSYECNDLHPQGYSVYVYQPQFCDALYGGMKQKVSGLIPSLADEETSVSIGLEASNGAQLSKSSVACCQSSTITLTSSNAGSTTITPRWVNSDGSTGQFTAELSGVTVNFTEAPQTEQPADQDNSNTQSQTNDQPNIVADEGLQTLTDEEVQTSRLIKLNGQDVTVEDGQTDDRTTVVDQSTPILLSGVTTPNALVKLYIFSDPQEAEVLSGEDGVWSYTIPSIEEGEHRIELEVLDSETGLVLVERSTVANFQVTQATEALSPQNEVSDAPDLVDEESSTLLPIVLAALAGLSMVGIVGWRLKNKQSVATNTLPSASASTVESTPEAETYKISNNNQ